MAVTVADLREIITTSLPDATLQIWIDAATAIVNGKAACISPANLDQTCLYLSAHFVAMLDPALRGMITKEGPEGITTSYSNPAKLVDLIDSTTYGMTANMLSNGCLAQISMPVASVEFA